MRTRLSPPADRAIPLLSPARDLARRFAAAWADEAARACAGEGEIVLVDGFAGVDYPAPSSVLPGVSGAAMRLLRDERARERIRVVMVEEDPAKVEWLARTLGCLLPGEALQARGELIPSLHLILG